MAVYPNAQQVVEIVDSPSAHEKTPTIVAIYNQKGGVGKTTTTLIFGWMLAELGSRVLMVDADHQRNLTQFAFSDEKPKAMPIGSRAWNLQLLWQKLLHPNSQNRLVCLANCKTLACPL